MSRAFVKEDGPEPDENPPEKPVSPHPNYVTPRGARLLQDDEARLSQELSTFAGAQDDAGRRRKRELERDLRYVRARLECAIPVESAPKDEIRFGARVVLRRGNGKTRTLRIVGEDEAEQGGELVPWSGPFVQALMGLRAGQALDWDGDAGKERWTAVSVNYPA